MSDTRIAEERIPAPAARRPRRRWPSFLRLVLAVVLLATVLIWKDNGARALDLLRRIAPGTLAALLALSYAVNWISMLKWRLILRERGSDLPRLMLMRLYLVGKFFSNFAPSMIGGDVARVVMLSRETGSGSRAAASVLIERFTGLATLVVLAIVAAATSPRLQQHPIVTAGVVGASLACVAALLVTWSPHARRWCVAAARSWPLLRTPATWLASLQAELAASLRPGLMLTGTILYSIAFYAVCSVSVYVAARAIGFDASYAAVAQLTPVLYLVSAIPVSTNNFGWWEWCFSVLLLDIGANLEQGLAVGLTLRIVTLVVSLTGGIWLLARGPDGTAGTRTDQH